MSDQQPENDTRPLPTAGAADAAELQAEVARLRAENERLASATATTTASPPPAPERAHRVTVRSVSALICFLLAALLTAPAIVGYWGQRTITDTQRYLETVEPLASEPAVQDALATTITNAIFEQVDTEELLNQVFAGVLTDRPRLEALVPPIAGAINSFIDTQVRNLLATDQFKELWMKVNEVAQQALVQALEGEPTGTVVALEGDQVVLDTSALIEEVKQRLVDRGLTIVENITIPDTDKKIVLLDAPQLAQARTIWAFTSPVAQWLIVVVAVLYLAAGLLARRRARMVVAIGIAVVINAVLLSIGIDIGRAEFVNALEGTVFGPASSVFYSTLLTFLERSVQVLLTIGIIMVVAGWFAGRNRPGREVRGWVSGGLRAAGARFPAGALTSAGAWVGGNARWLRVVAVVIGVLVLFIGADVSVGKALWSLVLVLVLLAAIEVLVGAGEVRPAVEQPAEPVAVA